MHEAENVWKPRRQWKSSEHPAVASTGAGGPDRAGSFKPFEMIFAESMVTGHCLLDPLRPFWTCSSLLPNRCERNAQKHPKAWNKDLEVPHLAWITRENHIQTWTRWKHVKIMDTFFLAQEMRICSFAIVGWFNCSANFNSIQPLRVGRAWKSSPATQGTEWARTRKPAWDLSEQWHVELSYN